MATRTADRLPSFSIVLETANLSVAEVEGLNETLDALKRQEAVSVDDANEVVLADGGNVPSDMLEGLAASNPWIRVHQVEPGTHYYQEKMAALPLVTADVVLFCDSDCRYESNWLESMLRPFAENDDVELVAGQTDFGEGPYGLALRMAHIFPAYPKRRTLYPSKTYVANNVAFRRDLLLQHPIPDKVPGFRGDCVVHAHELRASGHVVWTQPSARATHARPQGVSGFLEMVFGSGRDAVLIARTLEGSPTEGLSLSKRLNLGGRVIAVKWLETVRRTWRLLTQRPQRLLWLPVALPIAAVALLLFTVGAIIASVPRSPRWR